MPESVLCGIVTLDGVPQNVLGSSTAATSEHLRTVIAHELHNRIVYVLLG